MAKTKVTTEAVYACISYFISDYGYSPTVREIMALTGLQSAQSVHRKLHRLKGEGKIDFVDGKARTIRLTSTHEHCSDSDLIEITTFDNLMNGYKKYVCSVCRMEHVREIDEVLLVSDVVNDED